MNRRQTVLLVGAVLLACGPGGLAEAGLVAHFPLDEPAASGDPVANTAGSLSGTLINPAFVTQGAAPAPFGTAYDFAPGASGGGVNTSVNAATKPNDDFTITLWFEADLLDPFDRLIESMDGTVATSQGIRFDLGGAGNRFRALLRDGSGSSNNFEHPTTLSTGSWYFAAVRFDKDSDLAVTLIPENSVVDAGAVAGNTVTQASVLGEIKYQNSRPTIFAVEQPAGPAANALDGRMDDVAFFNHLLSDAELAQVYNAGAASQPRSALLGWNAADAPVNDGTRDEWLPRLGAGFDWNFNNANGPTQEAVASSFGGITHAYRYTGDENVSFSRTSDDGGNSDSFGDNDMGLGDVGSTSFELWFKPTDLVGEHVLWETGGNNGASLTLNDDVLRFGTSGGGSSPDPSGVTYQLVAADLDEFLQVIGVIDQEANETRMYVNGVEVGTAVPNAPNDWSGTNASGLGTVQGNATGGYIGNPTAHGTFVGDIAMFNFYQYPLSDTEAMAAFDAVAGAAAVPEPATLWLLGLGALFLLARFRRRR